MKCGASFDHFRRLVAEKTAYRFAALSFAALILLVCWLVISCQTGTSQKAPAYGDAAETCGAAASEGSDSSWARDIEVLGNELPKCHKNLFFQLSEAEYRARLRTLEAELGTLSDLEVELRVRRLLADLGDAHTGLSLQHEQIYPLSFLHFADGTYLMKASAEYAEYLGMRLVSVDQTPLGEARRRISTIIPYDNRAQLWNRYASYLVIPRYLGGLGIITGNGERPSAATFVFRSEAGERHSVEVDPVSRDASLEWRRLTQHVLSIPEDRKDIPLYMQNTRQAYWSRYLESEGILYMQYNECREDPAKPFRPFARGIERELRREGVRKLVIDLRFNGGGDSRVLHPLIRTLERDYREGREYELYTIVGRGTFSSAVLNAIDLKQRAGAVLVGEPSAGRPNHYGEVKSMRLPHSGMRLFYSTKYFSRYEKDSNALYPDISVAWSFADILTWNDEAMEAVRAQ
jgi:hypothetical protein